MAHSTKVAEDIEWAKAKREANAEEQAAIRRNEEQEAEQRIIDEKKKLEAKE